MNLILGIDPGISGGAALVSKDRTFVHVESFKRSTPADLIKWLFEHKLKISMGYLEGVGAKPSDGVVPAFKFGMNYGWWQGVLAALEVPFERVYPLKWQTALSCRTGGNKNVSKIRAQELFPGMKITHATADALLIAEYGRRLYLQTHVKDL